MQPGSVHKVEGIGKVYGNEGRIFDRIVMDIVMYVVVVSSSCRRHNRRRVREPHTKIN